MSRIIPYSVFVKTSDLKETIDPNEFPDPLPQKLMKYFSTKGKMDGDPNDDKIRTKKASWSAVNLLPSQDAIYLGKTLGMAIGGVKGGELGSIVSNDMRILDGHHRWAATMFNDPKAKVGGIEVDMNIRELIPVLRSMGDAYGNARRGNPGGSDINIFEASVDDAILAVKEGKYMNPKFYDQSKALEWLEQIGGEQVLKARLQKIQSMTPPADAPPRIKMPVIDADKKQHLSVATAMKQGNIDINPPYAKIGEAKEEVEAERPLMKWFREFEKELKKLGGSYAKINPTDMLELYYDHETPKDAAKKLKK